MGYLGYRFKTKTDNGRVAKTTVFMPEEGIVVIHRLILAKEQDIKEGWFVKGWPVKIFKDYVLMEQEFVFWTESFKMVVEAFGELNKQWEK